MQIQNDSPTGNSLLQNINAFLGKIEIGFLCLIIAMMIGLAILKIVMRYVFNASLLWSDMMLQHLTLWLCFFGAALATCERRHISIDVLSRILPGKITRWTNLVIDCIALVVVGILAYYGFLFLGDEQIKRGCPHRKRPVVVGKGDYPLRFCPHRYPYRPTDRHQPNRE